MKIRIENFELPRIEPKKKVSKLEKAISRILKRSGSPRLDAIHKTENNMIEFTDSYVYFRIHDFDNELPVYDEYVDIERLINHTEPCKQFEVKAETIREVYKTVKTLKENTPESDRYYYVKKVVYINIGDDETPVWINGTYLIDTLDVLQFGNEDYVIFDYFRQMRPIQVRKSDELAVLAPVKRNM